METQFADSEIRSEMIKALRGDDSQFDLSRELGFSFNQVHKWESGAKRFLWPEFVALCQLKKIPILEILRKVFSFLGDDPADAQELMFCLKQFFAHLSIDGLAKEVEVHPSMLRRWLAGSVVPDLDIVLKLLSLRPGLLQSFLANVFPDRQLPILHESLDRYKNQKLMEAQLPIAPAIEAVLSTEDYRKLVDHSDNWVAEKVGTTADVINSAMAVMLKAGTIKQEDRKFVVTYNRIDMHGLDQKISYAWLVTGPLKLPIVLLSSEYPSRQMILIGSPICWDIGLFPCPKSRQRK